MIESAAAALMQLQPLVGTSISKSLGLFAAAVELLGGYASPEIEPLLGSYVVRGEVAALVAKQWRSLRASQLQLAKKMVPLSMGMLRHLDPVVRKRGLEVFLATWVRVARSAGKAGAVTVEDLMFCRLRFSVRGCYRRTDNPAVSALVISRVRRGIPLAPHPPF